MNRDSLFHAVDKELDKLNEAFARPIAGDGVPIYEGETLDWGGQLGICAGFEFSGGRVSVLFKHLDEYEDMDWPSPGALRHVKASEAPFREEEEGIG